MTETLLISLWLLWAPLLVPLQHVATDVGHALHAVALRVPACLTRP